MMAVLMAWILAQDEAARGETAYREGRYEEAAVLLLRAAEAAPKSAPAWITAGHACLQARRPGDARRCYRAAEALGPAKADLFRGLGQALLLEGRPAEALEPLRKAESMEPGGPEPAWLARARLELGDAEGAVLELHRARATPEVLELSAVALSRAGRHAESAGALRRLVALQPAEPRHRRSLGAEEIAAGRSGEAIDALEAACRLGDRDAGTVRLLGDLYVRAQMSREAAGIYARLSEPTAEDRYRLGVARWTAGESTAAREAFEAAGTAHEPSLLFLARILAAGTDPEAGRRACTAALSRVPAAVEPAVWLGDLESRGGRHVEAAAAYGEAWKRGDTRALTAYHRGRALLRSGDAAEARKAVREGLRMNPLDESLRGLLRELNESRGP
jgi:tetratricopeptide (TPR) repeat protein